MSFWISYLSLTCARQNVVVKHAPLAAPPRQILRLLAAALFVALFATACGSESAPVEAVDAAADPSSQPTSTPDQDQGASSDRSDTETTDTGDTAKTLDDYLGSLARVARGGGGGGPGGADDAQQEQAMVEVEIQRCMQAEGFEYVPEETGGGLGQFLAQINQGLSAKEFAETKGFGISTRFDEVLEGDVVLADDETDPNDEHLATLSDSEADAWRFALRGAPIERNAQGQPIDPETGEVLAGGRGRGPLGGCSAEANTIVRGDRSAIDALSGEFDELDARIAADARIAEIGREWASCMRDAGFAYETVDEARGEINQDFRPLIREAFGRGGPGQGRPSLADISLTPDQELALNQLQDREIALAVASHRCEGDTAAEIAEIEARYEADFVEENRAALEAIRGS